MRILTGIQPSGKLHWGNYFGAMKSMFDLQAKGEDMFMFIANFHAMTTVRDGAALRESTREVALDYLACGLDPAKTYTATEYTADEPRSFTVNGADPRIEANFTRSYLLKLTENK